jgi:hypothetical protein
MKTKKESLPPYIPFKTFLNFIAKLKETHVPPQIDRSVLRGYSGSAASGLTTALKFLNLIDDNGKTLTQMYELVEKYGTPAWKEKLEQMMNEIYSLVIGDLDIRTATRNQLEERFKNTGAEKGVLSKCLNFYISAVREAGINLSSYITKSNRGRREQPRKRVAKFEPKREKKSDGADIFVAGTVQFNIPVLPGKPSVKIYVPEGISKEEWDTVNNTMVSYISLIQRKKEQK